VLDSSLQVSNKISNRISVLLNKTKKLSEGKFTDNIIVEHDDEIGELSNAFNKMDKELRISIGHLKKEVAERIQTEKKLKEASDFSNDIIETSLDAIVVTDSKGIIIRTNNAYQELVGFSEKKLIGKQSAEM